MNEMTRSLLLLLMVLVAAGCSTTAEAMRTSAVQTNVVSRVNPADWGPAYVKGMENGPASREHSIAMHKAERFMAKQNFANQYARRACIVGGYELIDVSFALLSDKTGKTRGIVKVNLKTGECYWVGEDK